MSNTNAPFGFIPYGSESGPPTNFALQERSILYSYGTKIHRGTPVIDASGYINVATASTVQMAGIFWDCNYYSPAVNRWIWSKYWPAGSPSGTLDATARIITDLNVDFLCQTDGTSAVAFASIGNNIQLVTGTGNDTTGMSGYTADHTPNTTNTYPFRMVGLLSQKAPPGTNGTDNTAAYNQIIVRLNYADRRSALGVA